ncbi:hypothetical protein D3C71_1561780 [compost metagenome]
MASDDGKRRPQIVGQPGDQPLAELLLLLFPGLADLQLLHHGIKGIFQQPDFIRLVYRDNRRQSAALYSHRRLQPEQTSADAGKEQPRD